MAPVAFREYRRGQRILFSKEGDYTAAAAALKDRGFKAPYHGKNWFEDREQFPFYIWVNAAEDGSPLNAEKVQEIRSVVESVARKGAKPESVDAAPRHVVIPADIGRLIREETNRIESLLSSRLADIVDSVTALPAAVDDRITPRLKVLAAGDDEKLKTLISSQVDRSREKQLEEEKETLRKELADLVQEWQHEEDQRKGAESHAERLESEKRYLELELQRLRASLAERTWQIPDRLFPMVQDLSARWPDRLLISETALNDARNAKLNDGHSKVRELQKVWSLLQHLPTTLYEMVFDEEVTDLDQQFLNRTGFELALTEGKQTKADADLIRERTIWVDGEEYLCMSHVKYDWGDRRLRVHLAMDHAKRKIIIGRCGDHPESAGTRRIR